MKVAIVSCFDTYEHRVDLIKSYFENRGDSVRIYTSNYRHIEKNIRNDNKENYVYINVIKYKKNLSLSRIYSHMQFSKNIFKKLENQNIDLLWVLIPPNSLVKNAAKYKKNHPNTKLIIDVIDMWPETMPVKKIKNFPLIKMWKNLRNKWIDVADHVVTECNLYQEELVKYIERSKMTTLYLARKIEEFKGNPNPPKDKIALCYLGSINNIIDISAIGNIIKKLSKSKPVILHIIGDGEKRDELIVTAENIGVEVIYHGKIYDAIEKQKIFDSCHYGLNIMKESVFVGLTMKSMDYFEAGLPIINNIRGDTWNMVEKYIIGVNIDSLNNLRLRGLNRRDIRDFYEKYLSFQYFCQTMEKILIKI